MAKQAYKANIQLAFNCNNSREYLDPMNINYIMIESMFDSSNLPIIYVSLNVTNDQYNKMIAYKDSATFYLKINRENASTTTILGVSKNILEGTFTYIPSDINPNYQDDLNSEDIARMSYRKMMIGLVSNELTNKLRKTFNGVYNDIDMETLLGIIVNGTNCVVEKPTYNDYFESYLVPPVTSRFQALNYIFETSPFYDTNFRYFIDFQRSYLISKRGKPVSIGDGSLTDIYIDVKSIADNDTYVDGIQIKNNAYYIDLNPSESNIVLDQGTEKVANQIISVSDSEVSATDLSINNSIGSEIKQLFVRSNLSNATLYKNEMETNTIVLEIVKNNIDGSIFTPNKRIIVNNYKDYSEYNGDYLLLYKREFFKQISGEFAISCNVGLKMIGNLEVSNRAISTKTAKSALSSSSAKTSSTSTKKTNKSTTKAVRTATKLSTISR